MRDKYSGSDPVEEIMKILEEERSFLISGNVSGLHDLVTEKEFQLGNLKELRGSAYECELGVIREKIFENQNLYKEAASGISAARDRIEALRHPEAQMRVYDSQGRPGSIMYALSGKRV